MEKKGQVTIETLIILSTSILLLIVFVIVAWDEMFLAYNVQQTDVGKAAMERLADEVNDVYYSGVGTTKQISLILPDSSDFDESFMVGRTIILNVADSDVLASTDVDINGFWPEAPGNTVFTLVADYNKVHILVEE